MRDTLSSTFRKDAFKLDIAARRGISSPGASHVASWVQQGALGSGLMVLAGDWGEVINESPFHRRSEEVCGYSPHLLTAFREFVRQPTQQSSTITSLPPVDQKLTLLQSLRAGWDGERADRPSEISINAANFVIKRLPSSLIIFEIEADVIGGVTLWLASADRTSDIKWAWFSCRNSGKILLTLDEHKKGGYLDVGAVEDLDMAFRKASDFLRS